MDPDQEDVESADRRVENAKASLRARFHELERRVDSARERLDVPAHISSNPLLAVGIAAGVGALLGLLGGGSAPRAPRAPRAPGEHGSTGSAIFAALGALAIQALKDMALSEGGEMAKKWWADRNERIASTDSSVEPFLEH
jgi:hypothetical protein